MSAADRFELRRALLAMLPGRLRRSVLATPPYIGYLERPGPQELAAADGTLAVAGWVFSPGAGIRALTARAGGGPEVPLRSGLPRHDLAAQFSDEPRAAYAGFAGQVPVPEGEGAVTLTIFARGAADRRVTCFSTTVLAPVRAVSPSEQARAQRLRQPFISWLTAAAASHPRVIDAGPHIFDALCEQWQRRGEPIGELERMFLAPPGRRPAAVPRRVEHRELLVVSAMFPATGHGGGLRLFDILAQLGERHTIDLYSTYREDLDSASLAALLPSLRSVRLWPSDELDAGDILEWTRRHGAGPGHYDAVHFEWPQTAAIIAAVAPLGRRSLFTLMECTTRASVLGLEQALDRPAALGVAARRFVKAFARERNALAGCHTGIAVSDEDADFAVQAFGVPRPQVIPTCLSDREFLSHLPAAAAESMPPIAAFVGYFDHYPNQDAVAWYLREVHFRVRERVPDYRLHIIGRGDTTRLRALHPGERSIVFTGPVDDLAAAIAGARIGVAPMFSGAGIRGKISQHAAARRPVVSTTLGASGLPFRDGREIMLADAPESFAEAVVRLLTDDGWWRQVSEAAYARAMSECRWPPFIARLESLHGA